MTATEIRALRSKAVADKDDLMIRLCDTALRGMGGLTTENLRSLAPSGSLQGLVVDLFMTTYPGVTPTPVAVDDITAWLNEQMETAAKHDDQDWIDACRAILAGVDALQAKDS